MPNVRNESASCEGKTRYPSPQAARPTIERMKDAATYHCEYCGSWHVGTRVRMQKEMKER